MGVVVSSSHIVSAVSSSSLPLLCEVPLTGNSSPQTAPALVPSVGCSPSGIGCSSVGPPQGHKSCQQTCSSMGCSLPVSTGPGRSPLQRGLSTGSCKHPCALARCPQRAACGCVPPWTSMGYRGTACLTMVFSTGCKGISAPVPGAPPPPPSLTLVSAELFLSHFLTPLSG